MRSLADRFHQQALADADDRELVSRTDKRRQQTTRETALKDLATRLVALKPRQLERMGLGEPMLVAIRLAQSIKSPPARNRQVTVVRQHLRDSGPRVDEIEARLKALLLGVALPALAGVEPEVSEKAMPEVLSWSERLMSEGDEALEEFLRDHPGADRQLLRQQARAASKAGRTADTSGAERARSKLRVSIERFMQAAPAEPDAAVLSR
jgi:ribosome-associated protein